MNKFEFKDLAEKLGGTVDKSYKCLVWFNTTYDRDLAVLKMAQNHHIMVEASEDDNLLATITTDSDGSVWKVVR